MAEGTVVVEASKSLSDYIKTNSEVFSQNMVGRQYAMQPGVWEKYGPSGYQKSLQDAKYHLSFLIEALMLESPDILTNYIEWLSVIFQAIKLPDDALKLSTILMGEVIKENAPADLLSTLDEYIAAAITTLEAPVKIPSTFLKPGSLFLTLAEGYLQALLKWDRQAANKLIVDAAANGVPLENIYVNIFEPVQKEVGRLWQLNRLSVAQEHFCSATTQSIMGQFYPKLFATPKNGRTMVATCVSRELHEMGIRMVADVFELHGWSTYYLGANTPKESILTTLKEQQAEVLCISTTMGFQLEQARELISSVRTSSMSDKVMILVGGYPFNLVPDLWQKVKADGYAADAISAVELASKKLAP